MNIRTGDVFTFTRPWRRNYKVRHVSGGKVYLAGVGSMVDMPLSTLRSMINAGDVRMTERD